MEINREELEVEMEGNIYPINIQYQTTRKQNLKFIYLHSIEEIVIKTPSRLSEEKILELFEKKKDDIKELINQSDLSQKIKKLRNMQAKFRMHQKRCH